MILPITQGGFFGARTVHGRLFIGDTSLSKYIPKYIKPLSYRNNITCGFKTCKSDILPKSDLNKWMISQVEKLDKLYINYVSTWLLQRYKHDFIEYNSQIFPNNSHIHLSACDDASSYHCPYPVTVSNIPQLDCIFNCCYDFPRMNAPYLKSSEQLDRFYPAPLMKLKTIYLKTVLNIK